jgi:hypothetical protein
MLLFPEASMHVLGTTKDSHRPEWHDAVTWPVSYTRPWPAANEYLC